MKNSKSKMICKLLSSAMVLSMVNVPTTFAEGSVVMQIGSNGSAVVDKVSTASTVKTNSGIPNVGGKLLQGKLENAYQTTYTEMTGSGNATIDIDNDFLNNINDATFEMWVDNNFSSDNARDRAGRYLFGLYDEVNKKEVFSIDANNGTEYDNRGYGFYAEVNGSRAYNERKPNYTLFDEWMHFVVTFDTTNDGSSTKFSVYRDGVFAFDNTIKNIDNGDGTYTSAIGSGDIRLRLGHSTFAGTHDTHYGFVGRLGDLKVYDYAMTKNEIVSLRNSNKALYINDLSSTFSIEKHDGKGGTLGKDKVEACAATTANGYVLNPYAAGGTVKVSFTAPINKNSISEETINLVDESGNVVPGSTTVTISDMGYVAYITYGQLTEGAKYAVKLNGLKSVNNIVLNDVTSQYFTFTGGTAENGIILVRPFKGKEIEFTLNYPLAADEFDPELCLVGTTFDLDGATYDEATRTITLTSTEKFVSGKEYTVGYNGLTKTFTAIADGEFVIEVPVAPEEVEPEIPFAPAEPEGSMIMNVSVVDGKLVDTTGNATSVEKIYIPAVGGEFKTGYLANENRTPYFEFTQNGAYVVEVDSPAIEGLDNMTFDVWVKNDDRNIDTSENQRNRYDNTLFTIADPTVDVQTTDPTIYRVGLHDGTTYADAGYGFTGVAKSITGADINKRHHTTDSSMWDEWSHIVITKEKPANENYYYLNYYLNGENVGKSWVEHTTKDGVSGDVLDWNDTVLRIGHKDSVGKHDKWYGLIGKVSEFKVFNYTKTDGEIKQQYEARKYNYIEDLSDSFTLELVEASKDTMADYPRGPWAANGKIKATFSAAINPATIDENTLTLVDASGNVIPGGVTVELSEQGSVAYISCGQVAAGSEYYLKVNGLQSMNGVPLKVTSSEPIVFIEGGEAENGIHLVKGYKGNTIEITLNYPLAAADFDSSKAVLSAGGYDFENTTATYDETTRTITLTNDVDFVQRGKYLFTYDGMSKNFIAQEYVEPVAPITIGTPVFKDQAGTVINANSITGVTSICSDVDVVTDGMTDFVAILSVYNRGKLVGMDMIGTNNSGCINKFTNEVPDLDSGKTYTFKLEVKSLEDGEEYTSKLMLWESMNNMKPYTMYTPSGE